MPVTTRATAFLTAWTLENRVERRTQPGFVSGHNCNQTKHVCIVAE